ncbi:MAG TPA: monovalent cation/H+ antiporter complex subunit F [Methylomirabilota bacterium]|nr:monovalent cation/H+ antiporter complex subunit F [Methylomirabilota bacterium]
MNTFLLTITIGLVGIILIPFYRVVRGPTVFDRLLAMGAMGAKTIALICLIGLLYGRLDMFVDIALAYAILNFIGGIAMAKYFKSTKEAAL